MLKKISGLTGIQVMSSQEQRGVKGGTAGCNPNTDCCGVCTCGVSNFFAYPGQYCGICIIGDHHTPYYAGPGCV